MFYPSQQDQFPVIPPHSKYDSQKNHNYLLALLEPCAPALGQKLLNRGKPLMEVPDGSAQNSGEGDRAPARFVTAPSRSSLCFWWVRNKPLRSFVKLQFWSINSLAAAFRSAGCPLRPRSGGSNGGWREGRGSGDGAEIRDAEDTR